jgi:hypothetical protein
MRSRQGSQRQSNNRRDYGTSENRDYGRGPATVQSWQATQARSQQSASDPDYAQYRLKKFFDEKWAPTGLK